jgi:hypothetical protein
VPDLSVSLDLLGHAVRVEVDDGSAAVHVGNLLRGFARTEADPSRTLRLTVRTAPADGAPTFSLHDGERVVAREATGSIAVRTLLWSLNQLALGTCRYAVLHAGAVAWGAAAVVLPAPSEAGKSTLVAALVRDGFAFLSDEFAPLAVEDCRLRAYRCPLGLDAGSFRLFPELRPHTPCALEDAEHWLVPIAGVAESAQGDRFAPRALIFPTYLAGGPATLTPLDAKDALALAANETLNLFELGRTGFATLCQVIRTTPAFRLTFDDLSQACAAVRDALGVGPRP